MLHSETLSVIVDPKMQVIISQKACIHIAFDGTSSIQIDWFVYPPVQ